MKPTPEQEAFQSAMAIGQSICLEAVAGSGKTTTLIGSLPGWAAAFPARRGLFIAFNKRNVVEFERKIEEKGFDLPSITAKTCNALGHRAWMSALKGKKVNLNTRKTFDIIKSLFPYEQSKAFPDLFRVIAFCKIWPMVPPGAINGPKNWAPARLEELIEEKDFEVGMTWSLALTMIEDVLRESIKQAWAGTIDFDDQLYMPIVSGSSFDRYDLIIVDEAQDLNGIQHEMLRRSLRPGGQMIAAGDSRQAIYGFRGADSRSMAKLSEAFDLAPMPLTVSFRCPKAVVREAQKLVPQIQPFEKSIEGEVKYGDLSDIPPGSAVLSRYNRHLIPVAYSFIRAGIPAKILGSEIGKNLAKLVRSEEKPSLEATLQALSDHCTFEAARCAKKGNESKAQQWLEKYDIIEAIADFSRARSAEDLSQAILALFSDEASTITLSTIHKAKGMEWPVVGFVAPELVPSRWAKAAGGVELEQDLNCKYVAITRAQKKLVFIPEAVLETALAKRASLTTGTGLTASKSVEPAVEPSLLPSLEDLL
jgi:hypothetical protein